MTNNPTALAIVFAGALASPVRLSPSERLRFARLATEEFSAALAAPAALAPRPDRYRHDDLARAIYDSWKDQPGWVPWVERGNSQMQERVRQEAALAADQQERRRTSTGFLIVRSVSRDAPINPIPHRTEICDELSAIGVETKACVS